jgi:hypothetical protein
LAPLAEAGASLPGTGPPFSACEDTKPRKTPVWFALSAERPLFAFARIWTGWTGVRDPKLNPVDGEHDLYAF